MRVVILQDKEQVANFGADFLVDFVNQKSNAVLGLATGSSPVALYENLIDTHRDGEVSFADTITFNLDEYLGLSGTHEQSYRHFMQSNLFDQIDIKRENTHVPLGDCDDPLAECCRYEAAIKQAGGIDVQLLGIGRNGHIGFNEPSSSLASRTRIKTLTADTVSDNARFFEPGEYQPTLSITMGIGTILDSKSVLLIATGKQKADAIAATIEGPISANCPASALQMHPNVTVVLDCEAASKLKNRSFYQQVEAQRSELEMRLSA